MRTTVHNATSGLNTLVTQRQWLSLPIEAAIVDHVSRGFAQPREICFKLPSECRVSNEKERLKGSGACFWPVYRS